MGIRLDDPHPVTVPTWRVVAALIASALLLWFAGDPDQATTTATSPDPLATCAEDDPCWDCSTMGNRRCGPATPASEGDNQP